MGVSDFVILNFIAIRKGISATLGTRAITLQGVSGELVLKEKMGVASVLLILHLTPNYRDQWVELEWTKTWDIPF